MMQSIFKASLKKVLAPRAGPNFILFVKFVVVLGRTFDYSLRRWKLVGRTGMADGT
jgi:hypothetical protein